MCIFVLNTDSVDCRVVTNKIAMTLIISATIFFQSGFNTFHSLIITPMVIIIIYVYLNVFVICLAIQSIFTFEL